MNKALINVDPQNDFFEGGALGVPHSLTIIPLLNKLMAYAAKQHWPVILSCDWHPSRTAHFKKWGVHCVQYTKGALFHSELVFPDAYLDIPGGKIIIYKGLSNEDDGYSPFEGVDESNMFLRDVLTTYGIKEVYISGLATDYCVKACVLDALKFGYKTTVITDAIAAVNLKPNDGELALQEMQAAGAILKTTKEVLDESI